MDAVINFFNLILDFLADINGFFASIWDYITVGLYDFFTEWFAAFVIWSTVAMIKFQIFAVGFAWGVAQEVLNQLNISAALSAVWSQLDSTLLNFMTFFKVPDVINILLSARVTRFVLNFMGV